MVQGCFANDLMGRTLGSELTVIHSLKLTVAAEEFALVCSMCLEEVKEDSECLSLTAAYDNEAARLVGVFATQESTLMYLTRVQAWLSESLGSTCQLSAVQVLSNTTELEQMQSSLADKSIAEDVRFCQVFPLSFYAPELTLAASTMNDFVNDI
eukprot:CAMPEP_0194544818 /NCGR_PEP_ID=MMETSP0253-20130528/88192_1 /TAXON_ID=2966 /ORGANISM="Noctiluca scintillans" /LENGTH=153 /DNA_ID=CAMNT_0039391745 /DNA_START=40 /DNA_END=498 /DNA_ORIENTATION=+